MRIITAWGIRIILAELSGDNHKPIIDGRRVKQISWLFKKRLRSK